MGKEKINIKINIKVKGSGQECPLYTFFWGYCECALITFVPLPDVT
jgi:hypothetical protein